MDGAADVFDDGAGVEVPPVVSWILASCVPTLHSDPIEVAGMRAAFRGFFSSASMFPSLKMDTDNLTGEGSTRGTREALPHCDGAPIMK